MTIGRELLAKVARAAAPRALVLVTAGVLVAVAWRVGGGAEPPAPPPRASVASVASSASVAVVDARAKYGEGYEVSVRLVEIASAARFELPRADGARAVMSAYPRQQRPPFVPVTDGAARFVTTIALRTSGFDQREALVSPPPGSITFRVNVPRGAKLTFAEGMINATDEATVFAVAVLDGQGARHEVYRHELQPTASRRWTDASCDLSAFAGQDVELVFSTEAAKATEPRVNARGDALTAPIAPVALWGNPTILAKTIPRLSSNVLWIVVGGLRPDAVASFHDDAAPPSPLAARLPKVPGLTPELDDLVRRGARFTHAYSAATWGRPGTLAMLAGARASELGIGTKDGIVPSSQAERFYGSDPPLVSLALRRHRMTTRAFVNDGFVVGDAPTGVDMGFERVIEHRDEFEIARSAAKWLKENKDTRFFAFVHLDARESSESTHLEKVPPPPAGPKGARARLYMAKVAKDDEAIGVVMRALDEAGLRDRTIVVVAADHAQALSSARAGASGLGETPSRDRRAARDYEQTTKVPILIVAPGVIAPNTDVEARVRSVDIAPTVLDLLGVERHARMSGESLLPLAGGQEEGGERVVVSEGQRSRAILHGRWRLVVHEGVGRVVAQGGDARATDVELFDLVDDPEERRDLASSRPEVVTEMKARLEAALKNVPVAGASGRPGALARPDGQGLPVLRLRFAGGSAPRRVSGTIAIGDGKTKPKTFDVTPIELGRDALRAEEGKIDVAFHTSPSAAVGFDVVIDPPTTPVTWALWLDDAPWPEEGTFGGPFGLVTPILSKGVATDEARFAAQSSALPTIDAQRDVGLFVTRERRGPHGSSRR